jgi:hypothetical protein
MPFVVFCLLVLWVLSMVDVARAPESRCRLFPKIGWLLIVGCVPTVGTVAWLLAGRPWSFLVPQPAPRPIDPWEEALYQRQCHTRAEAQRRAARRWADD